MSFGTVKLRAHAGGLRENVLGDATLLQEAVGSCSLPTEGSPAYRETCIELYERRRTNNANAYYRGSDAPTIQMHIAE